MKRRNAGPTRRAVLSGVIPGALAGLAPVRLWGQGARPGHWATPLPGVAGLPNLHRIAPGLYRAAQPDADGFASMADMGITLALSLRQTVDDAPLAAGTGLRTQRIPMMARAPDAGDFVQIVAALRALRNAPGPVLFHCHHGADRTGLIAALWAMLYLDRSAADALDELVNGGYGFHAVFAAIPRIVQSVDLPRLRARVEA